MVVRVASKDRSGCCRRGKDADSHPTVIRTSVWHGHLLDFLFVALSLLNLEAMEPAVSGTAFLRPLPSRLIFSSFHFLAGHVCNGCTTQPRQRVRTWRCQSLEKPHASCWRS